MSVSGEWLGNYGLSTEIDGLIQKQHWDEKARAGDTVGPLLSFPKALPNGINTIFLGKLHKNILRFHLWGKKGGGGTVCAHPHKSTKIFSFLYLSIRSEISNHACTFF